MFWGIVAGRLTSPATTLNSWNLDIKCEACRARSAWFSRYPFPLPIELVGFLDSYSDSRQISSIGAVNSFALLGLTAAPPGRTFPARPWGFRLGRLMRHGERAL